MNDVVIRAAGLGKKYLIGHQSKERYTALRDVMARSARNLMRSARDMMQGRQLVAGDEIEEFWALKDVNFEINRGDIVGIIGSNGAGKSTLLKILSRITEPSTGCVEIKGRVASLLEVGTGFHPELSGRENIFLNGAILGMSRAEIRRKFDEIIAFAEVEKFLDTPVKYYSSGMYVRLAFAVAAHLEPEILIVDEVLAVGDAAFQKKCMGKMDEVGKTGRTVLFVSHSLSALRNLCSEGMLFDRGSLKITGDIGHVIDAYERSFNRASGGFLSEANLNGTLIGTIRFDSVRISQSRKAQQILRSDQFLEIEIRGSCSRELPGFVLDINLFRDNVLLITCYDSDKRRRIFPGAFCSNFIFPKNVFRPGTYSMSIGASDLLEGWVISNNAAILEFSEAEHGQDHLLNRGLVNVPYSAEHCSW